MLEAAIASGSRVAEGQQWLRPGLGMSFKESVMRRLLQAAVRRGSS